MGLVRPHVWVSVWFQIPALQAASCLEHIGLLAEEAHHYTYFANWPGPFLLHGALLIHHDWSADVTARGGYNSRISL
jgi:hypothetical protein